MEQFKMEQYKFLKVVHYCNIGLITPAEAVGKYPHLSNLLKLSGVDAEFIKSVHGKRSFIQRNEPLKAKRTKLIQDQQDNATPSYPLVYRKHPKSIGSKRSQVLNEEWVCVPFFSSGKERENSSTKPRITSPSEEAMNQYEDHRYEFDMMLNYFRSALKNVEKLLNGIHRKEISLEDGFKLEDHLSLFNFRCIEQIYEGRIIFLEILREDPMVALPLICNRLKEKVEELDKMYQIVTSFGF